MKRRATNLEATKSLIGYCRVSTRKQAEDGVSLAEQEQRIRAYGVSRGEPIADIVREDESGAVAPLDRPKFAACVERVRAGEAGGIVAVKLDRLTRSTRDALDLFQMAGAEEWRLVTIQEQFDTGTPVGEFTLTMFAAVAQLERRQIAQRVKAGMDQTTREGRATSRFAPFGWSFDDGSKYSAVRAAKRSLVEDPAERRLLASLVELRDGGSGVRVIAKRMNEGGRENPRTRRPWTPGTVAAILRTYDRRSALVKEGV